MLLAEPTETRFDLAFTLFGVPVRVHPLFWAFMGLFGAMQMRGQPLASMLVSLGLWLVAVFISLLVHEMGHALVASRCRATIDIAAAGVQLQPEFTARKVERRSQVDTRAVVDDDDLEVTVRPLLGAERTQAVGEVV